MSSKYCSSCTQERLLSCFLKDASNPASKVLATCASCRAATARHSKRKALQPLDPNIQTKRRVPRSTKAPTCLNPSILPPNPVEAPPVPAETRPEATIPPPNPPESRLGANIPPPNPPESHPEAPIPIPTPPPIQPQAPGFLPADQWTSIQNFNRAMEQVKMESCSRCKERWFCMDLKNDVCHRCFNRDKGNKTPFLMSADNEMDPGEVPAHLPELTQVEEMIIARSHVQMMVHRYRGHQYHYSGHCVSFMQNNVKTVDILPNLPSELDIVVLRPSNQVEGDPRFQRQFRSDFRVRKGRVITWLRYLKDHHPDYRYITISPDRIDALPVDGDVSSSFAAIIDHEDPSVQDQLASDEPPPPNSQSMVPNLNITTTEVDLILNELAGRNSPPPGLPRSEE